MFLNAVRRIEETKLTPQTLILVPSKQVQNNAELLWHILHHKLYQDNQMKPNAVPPFDSFNGDFMYQGNRTRARKEEDAQQIATPSQRTVTVSLMVLVERLPGRAQTTLRVGMNLRQMGRCSVFNKDFESCAGCLAGCHRQGGTPHNFPLILQRSLGLDRQIFEGQSSLASLVVRERASYLRRLQPHHLEGPTLIAELPIFKHGRNFDRNGFVFCEVGDGVHSN
mmetsp:Transcript_3296/g.9531  ORF Transcript_3296/g.9531 Transcript_3296/m.9531 type:complete len:224 (+) Transcript_3296:328-999(+)